MKVGILTFHFAYNYGAVLQAWALQQAIESLGHQVCIINYVPEYMRGRISPFKGWGLRSGSNCLKIFSHRILGVKRRKAFAQFTRNHLKCSPLIRDKQALKIFCQKLDAIVVGSDQVWNLSWQRNFDDTYFLGFLEEEGGPRRIAYGACFGERDQPEHMLSDAIRLIRRFDAIGMRNQFGLEILEQVGNIQADAIVDPAFFISTESAGVKNDEIAVYAIAGDGATVCAKVAEQVAAVSNRKVIQICSEMNIHIPDNFKKITNASPTQWVEILANSSFICSESFHGVVLALANRVPFICASAGRRSARVTDLLDQYGVSERFLNNASDFRAEMTDLSLDYYPKLQSDIKASVNFLKESLDG